MHNEYVINGAHSADCFVNFGFNGRNVQLQCVKELVRTAHQKAADMTHDEKTVIGPVFQKTAFSKHAFAVA